MDRAGEVRFRRPLFGDTGDVAAGNRISLEAQIHFERGEVADVAGQPEVRILGIDLDDVNRYRGRTECGLIRQAGENVSRRQLRSSDVAPQAIELRAQTILQNVD